MARLLSVSPLHVLAPGPDHIDEVQGRQAGHLAKVPLLTQLACNLKKAHVLIGTALWLNSRGEEGKGREGQSRGLPLLGTCTTRRAKHCSANFVATARELPLHQGPVLEAQGVCIHPAKGDDRTPMWKDTCSHHGTEECDTRSFHCTEAEEQSYLFVSLLVRSFVFLLLLAQHPVEQARRGHSGAVRSWLLNAVCVA